MSTRCGDIVKVIEDWAKPVLAEDWDNVGLHVGDRAQMVSRIMVALTPSEQAVAQAVAQKADMLVTHHPLLFKPVENVTADSAVGRSIYQLIKHDIALYCAHTSLDSTTGGVNDVLAQTLALNHIRPLVAADEETWYKLVVYVPKGFEEKVRQAMCSAGAGHLTGNYDSCTFRTEGLGTFRPKAGAQPFCGTMGCLSQAEEYRLETVVSAANCAAVVQAMLKEHPYEEAAYDLFRLEPMLPSKAGMGRIGQLTQKVTLAQFLAQTAHALAVEDLTFCGAKDKFVQTVAVCGGSGSTFLAAAKKQGADVYVTGDLKYHDGQAAEELGLAVVDAGHFATERLVLQKLAAYLRQNLAPDLEKVWVWQEEADFLRHYRAEA